MAYDSVRQRVVLFGGRNAAGGMSGELWEWDGTTWTSRGTIGDPTFGYPAPRDSHGLAFDRLRNVLVLHGGQYALAPPSISAGETWELSGGGQWTRRAVAPDVVGHGLGLPDHRAMTYDWDHGATLLLTSRDETGGLGGRLWEWTGTSWSPRGIEIPWRENAAMAYDEARGRTAIVGGEEPYTARSDVWEWRYVDGPPPDCTP
jgi:hypothetical protein